MWYEIIHVIFQKKKILPCILNYIISSYTFGFLPCIFIVVLRWWNSSWAISNTERWCCESAALNMPANLENLAVATGLEKSVFIPISKNGNAKECSNYCTIALISHASQVMLKIPDVQAGFRRGRGTRDQIVNICWIMEKAREFQKKYLFLPYWLCQSLWLCGSQETVENPSRDGNTRPPDLPLEKSVCRSGSNS